jgi:hypothetical protein
MTLQAIIAMPQAKQAGLTEDKVEQVLAEIRSTLSRSDAPPRGTIHRIDNWKPVGFQLYFAVIRR